MRMKCLCQEQKQPRKHRVKFARVQPCWAVQGVGFQGRWPQQDTHCPCPRQGTAADNIHGEPGLCCKNNVTEGGRAPQASGIAINTLNCTQAAPETPKNELPGKAAGISSLEPLRVRLLQAARPPESFSQCPEQAVNMIPYFPQQRQCLQSLLVASTLLLLISLLRFPSLP